jgi:signal transduction histidine kinase
MLRRARDPITSENVILYIARDISDIIQARNDSLKASMKSEFLDVMAHEIRTPLHQIIGHVDLLEFRSELLDREQLESLQQIQASCSMLIAIINDLLDCSKLDNGKILKERITFHLNTLIFQCIESIRPQAQSKKLNIEYTIDENITTDPLTSDPNRLRQILDNLLSNAVKFTSTGSVKLLVEAVDVVSPQPDNDSVKLQQQPKKLILRFVVQDTGIGIDLKDQQIVFERRREYRFSGEFS